MLARCGAAGCILAVVAMGLFVLAAVRGDAFHAAGVGALYALACLSALVFLAGEGVPKMRKSRARGQSLRAGKPRPAAPPAPGAKSADVPPGGVDDLIGMLDDSLKLARPAPAIERREAVELTGLLKALAERKGRERVTLDARPKPLLTLASRPALVRACEILIDNALANGSRAAISSDGGTSALVVHVDDDGPGVPRDARMHVFEWRYYMSTPPSQQTGCRAELVIARQIARAHDGDITVTSSPLGGARFTVRLPLLGERELELAAAS